MHACRQAGSALNTQLYCNNTAALRRHTMAPLSQPWLRRLEPELATSECRGGLHVCLLVARCMQYCTALDRDRNCINWLQAVALATPLCTVCMHLHACSH